MSALNDFHPSATHRTGGDAPAHMALADPSFADAVDLPNVTQGFLMTVAGDLKIDTLGGETLVIPSGSFALNVQHALRIRRIWATGTAATGVFVFW